MEVLDLIYHLFFFTTNSLGCQPTTPQYFQPLTLPTLALAAAAIHCVLSENASGKKATVMFSQDEYRGTFCPSTVINFTLEATALINHTSVGRLIPPAAQLHYDRPSSIPIGTLQPRLMLFYFILHSIPLSALLNSHWRTSVWIVAHIFNSALLTHPPPFRRSSTCMGAPQSPSALLSLDLVLLFILCSTITFCVFLFSTQHSPSWPSSLPGGCSPFSSE